MKTSLAVAAALLMSSAAPAHAHRLDAYLQATTISVSRDAVQAQIRMTPGVAVFPALLASIDANGDGALSAAEQRAYAERVLHDLSLAIDGTRLPLRLARWKFGSIAELKEGRGIIQIDFDADVPRGGAERRLTFENDHQPRIAEYLVNALVPRDPDIRIAGQTRSFAQSSYRLDYTQASARALVQPRAWWEGPRGVIGGVALLMLVPLGLLSRASLVPSSPRLTSRI